MLGAQDIVHIQAFEDAGKTGVVGRSAECLDVAHGHGGNEPFNSGFLKNLYLLLVIVRSYDGGYVKDGSFLEAVLEIHVSVERNGGIALEDGILSLLLDVVGSIYVGEPDPPADKIVKVCKDIGNGHFRRCGDLSLSNCYVLLLESEVRDFRKAVIVLDLALEVT